MTGCEKDMICPKGLRKETTHYPVLCAQITVEWRGVNPDTAALE